MKKRIIFSSYDDMQNCFYGGGGAYAIHEISKRLSSKYSVMVLTGNYPGAKNIVKDGVFYKRIGPSFVGPRLGQLLFHFFLPFYVRKERFDLWIESFTPPFSTSCLQLFTKKPVIGLIHMLSGKDMKRKYLLPFDLIENLGLKTYREFIVLTEDIKQEVRKSNSQANITLIPNGVSLPEKTVRRKKRIVADPYFLFIGRLEYNQKGLDLLVDSYAKIAQKTTAKLVIAGSGRAQDISLLKKNIKRFHLEKQVVLLGRVTGETKQVLFQQCAAVIVSSRFETFGMSALEAMSYGKPLIGFAIDGLQWIPEKGMLKAAPFDTDQLSRLMQQLLVDKKQESRMSRFSTAFVHTYAWDVIQKQYESLIRRIII